MWPSCGVLKGLEDDEELPEEEEEEDEEKEPWAAQDRSR